MSSLISPYLILILLFCSIIKYSIKRIYERYSMVVKPHGVVSRKLLNENSIKGIAWLMSFPNSGTTYTQRLIQKTSGYSVASNYGHELIDDSGNVLTDSRIDSIQINSADVNGPFLTSSSLTAPLNAYLLTKTHCGGYCFSECPPNWYRLSPLKFLQECRLGLRYNYIEPGKPPRESWVQYDYENVKRIVHLIRNPFDNVVGRFFHEYELHSKLNDYHWLQKYSKDPLGFQNWCDETDKKWKFYERNLWGPDIFEASKGVRCHGEFTRYIRWHNNGFELHKGMNVPVFVLYYEDYANDTEGTLNDLFDFLGLTKIEAKLIPFSFSSHKEFYSQFDISKIANYIEYMATETSLKYIERYLVPETTIKHENHDAKQNDQVLFHNNEKQKKELINAIPNSAQSEKLLALINDDWQNNKAAAIEQKFYNVQAGLQKISEEWKSEKEKGYSLRYFFGH